MKNQQNVAKLPLKVKIGFGIGGATTSFCYDFASSFMLFYFTTIAGISPGFAGTIIAIAVLWNAVADPFMGAISDNSKSKYGKKRPFILASAFPMGICIGLLYTQVNFGSVFNNVYYLIIALLFWTSFTLYFVPYTSLGATITVDSDQRTAMSTIRQIFNSIGTVLATALPTYMLGTFVKKGFSTPSAWFIVACMVGALTTITALVAWRATRGREVIDVHQDRKGIKTILKDVKEIFSLKGYPVVIIGLGVFYVAHTINLGNLLFLGKYVLNVTEDSLSIVYVVLLSIMLILIPILGFISTKIDKKYVLVATLLFNAVVSLSAFFIGLSTLTGTLILVSLLAVGQSAFWTLSYPILYDFTELDEYENGLRREALIISFQSFVKKGGAAFTGIISGWILEFSGYDASVAVQIASAKTAILSMSTLVPGTATLICAICIILCPLNKKRHILLTKALAARNEGREYSSEGFETLVKKAK
jgi:glycoside/pentoside/hexuronide:cation symporter, GPH family